MGRGPLVETSHLIKLISGDIMGDILLKGNAYSDGIKQAGSTIVLLPLNWAVNIYNKLA